MRLSPIFFFKELEHCQAVVLSVTDESGIRTIMDQLMENTKSEKVEIRRSAATLLCAFCSSTQADYSQYVPLLLRGLIHLFTDSDRLVILTLNVIIIINNTSFII